MATDLTTVWHEADAALPDGWHLDSLRCASASLRPDDRSDDWIAVAVDTLGAEQMARAATPELAIRELVDQIASGHRQSST